MKQESELDPGSAEFARRAGELLERSAQAVPARIRSRLNRARQAALEHRGERPVPWRTWLPAGAAAAAVLAVLMLQTPGRGPESAPANGGEDFEMLADSGAYALAQDQLAQGGEVDYEFYDWAVNGDADERGAETGS